MMNAMNGTTTAPSTVGSMDGKDMASMQQGNPDSINTPSLNQQHDGLAGVPVLDANLLLQQQQQQGPGSFVAGVQGPGSTIGADGTLGAAGGGSIAAGDNNTRNVNKKLFVKRSCTEAMLKVGDTGLGVEAPGLERNSRGRDSPGCNTWTHTVCLDLGQREPH